jgi:hypothetical protein
LNTPGPVRQENAGDLGGCRAAIQADVRIEARQGGAELRITHHEGGAVADPGLDPLDVECTLAVALQPIQSEVSARAELDVEHGVGEVLVCAVVQVIDQQSGAAAGRHAHDDAGTGQGRSGTGRHQRELQHVVALLASRRRQMQRAGAQRGVQRHESLRAATGEQTQQLILGRSRQRGEREPAERGRDDACGRSVGQHQPLCGERSRHVDRPGRGNGGREPARFESAQTRVLPGFFARSGKSELRKSRHGCGATRGGALQRRLQPFERCAVVRGGRRGGDGAHAALASCLTQS